MKKLIIISFFVLIVSYAQAAEIILGAIGSVVTNNVVITNNILSRTGVTNSYQTYDDYYNYTNGVGMNWPNPRFTIQADAVSVKDNLTGLIWKRRSDYFTNYTTWANSVNLCHDLDGGTNGWRLPNRNELLSLLNMQYFNPSLGNTNSTAKWTANNPWSSIKTSPYWSSTTSPSTGTNYAMTVSVYDGNASSGTLKTSTNSAYAWPVRGP